MVRRLYTFGCSYTRYNMPTWADILCADQLERGLVDECYNYGVAGTGNTGILQQMCAVDAQHSFTQSDRIYVMWTSWNRLDQYIDTSISGERVGTVARGGNYANSQYVNTEYIRNYCSTEQDVINSCTAMWSANRAFPIVHNAYVTPSDSPRSVSEEQLTRYSELLDNRILWGNTPISELISQLQLNPSISHTRYASDLLRNTYATYDGHPQTPDHVNYVEKYILKQPVHLTVKHHLRLCDRLLHRRIKSFCEQHAVQLSDTADNALHSEWLDCVLNESHRQDIWDNFYSVYRIRGIPNPSASEDWQSHSHQLTDISYSADAVWAPAESHPSGADMTAGQLSKQGNWGVKQYLWWVLKRLINS